MISANEKCVLYALREKHNNTTPAQKPGRVNDNSAELSLFVEKCEKYVLSDKQTDLSHMYDLMF